MRFSGSTRSSPGICATSSAPITSMTSVSKKRLEHLDEVRQKFQVIISRFAGFQAQWLNVHVDFPLLQRMALPITIGSVRYPGIKIQDTRVIRLLEVLLHGSTHLGGWTAKEIHQAVLTAFHLSDADYGPQPTPLRSAQAQGARTVRARRHPLRLLPHLEGSSGRATVPVLP